MNGAGFGQAIASTRQRIADVGTTISAAEPLNTAARGYYMQKLQRLLAQKALHTLLADLIQRDVELQFCNATHPLTALPCQAPLVLEPPGIACAPSAGTIQCFHRCNTCGRDHVYFVTGAPAS